MATTTKQSAITSSWSTLAVVGYTGGVCEHEDRRAHGGVCLLQVRKVKGVVYGRKVNSNGRHKEVGEPWAINTETLRHWQEIAKAAG